MGVPLLLHFYVLYCKLELRMKKTSKRNISNKELLGQLGG